jgi:hypothetical protein
MKTNTAEKLEVLSTDAHDDVRESVLAVAGRDDLTQAAIAREAGVNAAALNRYLNGAYAGDNEALERKLSRWLDAYEARSREGQAMPAAPAWIETPTANQVLGALRYSQMAGDIAIVYGGAGLGKTAAALRYIEESPNVWRAVMTPATASVAAALEEVAEAVGLREIGGGGAKLQRAIVARMRGTYGLLIVDEAQNLSAAALDAIRSLHDLTGCGLALLGNEQVFSRMTGGNRAAYLDRLHSRIGKRVRLTRVGLEDVRALLNAWQIDAQRAGKVAFEIATKPGALRSLTKTIRLAAMVTPVEQIGADDLRRAWRELVGDAGGAS